MKMFLRRYGFTLVLMGVTAVAMTVAGVAFKQAAIRMIPFYISLIIGLMQTRAVRYAPLLGGINSIWYGCINLYYGLAASAMSCFLFSCPLQLITFWRWQRHKYGSSTRFCSLSWRWRILVALGFCAVWAGVFFVLRLIGSSYQLLDNTATLVGILVSFLTLFSFIEFAPMQLISAVLSIWLNVAMVRDFPEQMPSLIYSIYSAICVLLGLFSVMSLYKEQKAVALAAAKGEKYENSLG